MNNKKINRGLYPIVPSIKWINAKKIEHQQRIAKLNISLYLLLIMMALVSPVSFADQDDAQILNPDVWARRVPDLPSASELHLYQKSNQDIGIIYYLPRTQIQKNKNLPLGDGYEVSFFSGLKRQLSNEQWRILIDDKALITDNVIAPFLPNSWGNPDDARDKIFLENSIIQVVIENNSQMRADKCPNAPYDTFIRKMDLNGNILKEVVVLILNDKALSLGPVGECSSYVVKKPKFKQNIIRRIQSPFPNLFASPLNDGTFLYYGNNLVLRLTSDLETKSPLLNHQVFLLPRQEVRKIWDASTIKKSPSTRQYKVPEWDDVAGENALYQYLIEMTGEYRGK